MIKVNRNQQSIEFEDFEMVVIALVRESGPDDIKQEMDNPNSIGREDIRILYNKGYSIGDAAAAIRFTSEEWDEDYACRRLMSIAKRYDKHAQHIDSDKQRNSSHE